MIEDGVGKSAARNAVAQAAVGARVRVRTALADHWGHSQSPDRHIGRTAVVA